MPPMLKGGMAYGPVNASHFTALERIPAHGQPCAGAAFKLCDHVLPVPGLLVRPFVAKWRGGIILDAKLDGPGYFLARQQAGQEQAGVDTA